MQKLVIAAAFAFATCSFTGSALAADPPKPAAPAAPPAAPAKPADKAAPPPAAPAATPAAAPAGPPPPATELTESFKPMEGKWKCDGKAPDSPFGKAHATKADMVWKSDLNGYWYVMRYEEKKTKENATPYIMASSVGFDPSKKQLVRTDIDGIGMVTHLSSKGWEGDKMTWSGDVMGPQKMTFKETITKKSAKELASSLEIAGPDGKFTGIMEMTCKK